MTTYWIENADGQTLVEQQCKGMGSIYTFCDDVADEFTLEDARKLSETHGGKIVAPHYE